MDGEPPPVVGGFGTGSGQEVRVQVPALLRGVRVDRAVALLTGVSRAVAASLVADGHVSVDGRQIGERNRLLNEGEVLEISVGDRAVGPVMPEPDVPVDVVHADPDLVVVDKPAGLVVHPGAGRHDRTLVGGLLARFPDLAELSAAGVCDPRRPGIVHRLDRGTSGLLAVARTEPAYRSLVSQLSERSVERRYLALVRGQPEEDRGVVDAPIGRSARTPTRMAVSAQGRSARTRFRVLARYDEPVRSALLALALETGRTHQIRVHLAAIGHPVVGDDRYGRRRGDQLEAGLPEGRLFLHAGRLGLDHPSTGERMTWDSALPPDLADLIPDGPGSPTDLGGAGEP
ncbi:MAG TPA: RluA family pseudouridine synthase [Acidimicrobiales bacterium]|nr:RluA family pseudouridine synthase [Acidimicrobiales bacterium]